MTPSFFRVLAAVIVSAFMVAVHPSRALADDSSRISRLESEIQQLRTQIDAQNRRILRLEDELKRRMGGQPIPTIPDVRKDRTATVATGPLPWHSPGPWERVTEGMSEADVTSMLGEPTHIKSMDSFKTLFYQGQVAGFGALSGHVNFRDGRVVAVNKPTFDK